MTHCFAGLVRNTSNDLCVSIKLPSGILRIEAENLRATLKRLGTDEGYAAAAKVGLAAVDAFQEDRLEGRRSLSEIPYCTELNDFWIGSPTSRLPPARPVVHWVAAKMSQANALKVA